MSCEHLMAEGHCPVCQTARAHVHHAGSGLRMPLIVVALIAVLLLLAIQLH